MTRRPYPRRVVRCPFYRRDNGADRIFCEGITDESVLSLHFRGTKQFDIQMDTFCTDHYERCELCRMLTEKYEEGA